MAKLYFQDGAWLTPGSQSKEAERVDVPTAPQELADWLNARAVTPTGDPAASAPPPRPSSANCPDCGRSDRGAERAAESGDLEAIKGFILDQATPFQVEGIFGAIGTRFHELRKAATR